MTETEKLIGLMQKLIEECQGFNSRIFELALKVGSIEGELKQMRDKTPNKD